MEKTDAKAGRASASCSSPTLIWWLQHTRFFLFFFFPNSLIRTRQTHNQLVVPLPEQPLPRPPAPPRAGGTGRDTRTGEATRVTRAAAAVAHGNRPPPVRHGGLSVPPSPPPPDLAPPRVSGEAPAGNRPALPVGRNRLRAGFPPSAAEKPSFPPSACGRSGTALPGRRAEPGLRRTPEHRAQRGADKSRRRGPRSPGAGPAQPRAHRLPPRSPPPRRGLPSSAAATGTLTSGCRVLRRRGGPPAWRWAAELAGARRGPPIHGAATPPLPPPTPPPRERLRRRGGVMRGGYLRSATSNPAPPGPGPCAASIGSREEPGGGGVTNQAGREGRAQ